MSLETVPKELRRLRACLLCSLVKVIHICNVWCDPIVHCGVTRSLVVRVNLTWLSWVNHHQFSGVNQWWVIWLINQVVRNRNSPSPLFNDLILLQSKNRRKITPASTSCGTSTVVSSRPTPYWYTKQQCHNS